MRRFLGVILASLVLAACAETPVGPPPPPPPPPRYTPPPPPPVTDGFRDSDFAWSTAGGSGKLIGVMAFKGAAPRYTCQTVVLVPETPWTRSRMRTLYLSTVSAALPAEGVKARTPPESNNYRRFARLASCDPGGHFSFVGLPDGAFYAITVATPVTGGTQIALMRRVDVLGETVKVVLR
jgi:hypothetical protein